MYDFVSHILRRYFEATGWNEYNSYLNLTASSSAVLDFPVPTGLSLSISACPTPPFFTSYRLGALPNLHAGIGYIYASTEEPLHFGSSSKDVRFKDILERFRIVESPRPPRPKDQVWMAGSRVDTKDYLIYGCMHVPSARLDALYTSRLSPTWQLVVTAVSTPPKYPLTALQQAAMATSTSSRSSMASSTEKLDSSTYGISSTGSLAPANGTGASSSAPVSNANGPPNSGTGPPGSTNLQLTLQNDTGKWFTEYSYSVDDALWGFRVLHNFGNPDLGASSTPSGSNDAVVTSTREDSAESIDGVASSSNSDVGGGLRGQFSAGAEVFVSTVERSAGLSTGIRFSTLPDSPTSSSAVSPAQPSQPPTVITANLNPMMGHLSTAYAARMARDVVVCSRFDFNMYSYESEWTVGAEYWLRAARPGSLASQQRDPARESPALQVPPPPRASPVMVRDMVPPVRSQLSLRGDDHQLTESPASEREASVSMPPTLRPTPALNPITGCLKARISTTSDIRLLWQSRLKNCLVSLGVKADLNNTTSRTTAAGGIVKSIGIEIMYFSQAQD